MYLRVWRGIREHARARLTEWLGLFPLVGMPIVLAFQPNMFDLAPHYITLAEWADESTWEFFILVALFLRVVALIVNGTFQVFPYAPYLRLFASVIAAIIWSRFSFGFLEAAINHGTSGGPIVSYGLGVILEGANVFISSRDVGSHWRGKRDVSMG